MGTFVRLQCQHSFFFHQAENLIKVIGVAFRQVHHGNHFIVPVFADDMVVVFRETLIVVRADIFHRNLVFHPLPVLRIDMTQPFIFKIRDILAVVFFRDSVLRKPIGEEPVTIRPHFLLEGGFLIGAEILPYLTDPLHRQIRNQTLRVKCSGKTVTHFQLDLLPSSLDSGSTLCVSFLFLNHLIFQIAGCLLAERLEGRILRMIDHAHDFKSVLVDHNLRTEKLQLRYEKAYIMQCFFNFIPVRNRDSFAGSVFHIHGFGAAFPLFFRFIFIRILFFQAVSHSLRQRLQRLQFIFIVQEVSVADHRIVAFLVYYNQIQNTVIHIGSGADFFLDNNSGTIFAQSGDQHFFRHLFVIEIEAVFPEGNRAGGDPVGRRCSHFPLFPDQCQDILKGVACLIIVQRNDLCLVISFADLIIHRGHTGSKRLENVKNRNLIRNPFAVGSVQRSQISIVLRRDMILHIFCSNSQFIYLLRQESMPDGPSCFLPAVPVISGIMPVNFPDPAPGFTTGETS